MPRLDLASSHAAAELLVAVALDVFGVGLFFLARQLRRPRA